MSRAAAVGRAARDAARKAAFEALFAADLGGEVPELEDEQATMLVMTAQGQRVRFIGAIEPHLKTGWRFDRLARTDRALLLLGCAELLAFDTSPAAVASAYTDLAAMYGTTKSAGFVNAVLANLGRSLRGVEMRSLPHDEGKRA